MVSDIRKVYNGHHKARSKAEITAGPAVLVLAPQWGLTPPVWLGSDKNRPLERSRVALTAQPRRMLDYFGGRRRPLIKEIDDQNNEVCCLMRRWAERPANLKCFQFGIVMREMIWIIVGKFGDIA